MTFLRRHWPDLVITSLIVALLGGFAAVLLGPTASDGNAPVPSLATSTEEQPLEATAAPDAGTADADFQNEEEATLPVIPSSPGAAGASASTSTPASPRASAEKEPATGNTAPALALPLQEDVEADGPAQPAQERPDAGATAEPVATSRAGRPTSEDFRLGAGVFEDAAAAQAGTRAIRARGYDVHVIPIEQGVAVQIGPFADHESATRALQDVSRDIPGVKLYRPAGSVTDASGEPLPGQPAQATAAERDSSADVRGTADTPKPSTAAVVAPAPAETEQPAARPQAAPTTAEPAAVYLQVGAYQQHDSATRFVQQLREQGFEAVVNAPPGRVIRVMVGPFSGEALEQAESTLSELGIDHFRVR